MIQVQSQLNRLLDEFDCIKSVAIADLDGNPLRVAPVDCDREIAYCAAFGGIALRRTGVSERLSGRAEIHQIIIQGSHGSVMTNRLNDQLQLVLALDGTYSVHRVQTAVDAMLKQLMSVLTSHMPSS